MAKRSIALNLRSFNYASLLVFAEIIRKGFIKKSSDYPSPVPSIAEQQTANDKMKEDMKKWGGKGNPRGSDLSLSHLELSSEKVKDNLKRSAKHVVAETPDSPELWEEVGFVLKKLPGKRNISEAVQSLRQIMRRNIPLHWVRLMWKRPPGVAATTPISYKIFRSQDAWVQNAVYIDTVLMKANYTDKNVPSTGKWYYWVQPYTTAGDGMMSGVCMTHAFVD